jgi:DNA-binding transcriptional MerR regulator
MENLISIGQMARLNNVSVQTLHHYERLGLLLPKYRDPDSNYRYYSILQSRKLDLILHLKDLGMSLPEIQKMLASGSVEKHQSRLVDQRENLKKKICELKQTQRAVETSLQNIENYNNAPKAPEVVFEHIPTRTILIYDGEYNIYEESYSTFQYSMREFKKRLSMGHLPQPFFYNVGGIIRKKHFAQRQFFANEIFIFRNRNYNYKGKVEQVPEGDYACMYFDNEHDELEYAGMLWDEIKKRNYEIAGDYLFEVMADLPIVFQDEHKMFIKIQVRVE